MVAKDKNTDKGTEKRTHRANDELGIEKSNRAFTNIEKQISNLHKAKRNILLSGDKELGEKFNIALGNFADTLTGVSIEKSEWDISAPEKVSKESFNIADIEPISEDS